MNLLTSKLSLTISTPLGHRLKGESKKGRKFEWFKEGKKFSNIKGNAILYNLVSLGEFITQELKFRRILGVSDKLLLEITSFYLDIPLIERTNPKSGKVTYSYSKTAYNYAYALRYLWLMV